MSASPDTDRSLNADKPASGSDVTNAAAGDDVNIAPRVHPVMSVDAAGLDQKSGAGEVSTTTDLSTLTHEQLEARIKTLTETLTSANTEAEFFRQQWQELRLRDEALGVEALTVDQRKLEDGKVEAVAELYKSEMKRREALTLLEKLLATTSQMIQTAPNYDPQVRADYEVASRAAKDYLGGHSGASIPLGSSLADGQISDINPELNAVIVNLGKTQGVKEGMPFLIYQDNQQVGSVKIVLARDQVSAGLVESVKPNTVLKVGDRVAVDAGQ